MTVKVNRIAAPEVGWHECDRYEVYLSTVGTGGGSVRFGFLNLTVNGTSVAVASKGTQYEITSMLIEREQ